MSGRILFVGRADVTLDMRMEYLPNLDHTGKGDSYSRFAGGSAVVASVAASKLGAKAFICSKFGRDSNGTRIREYLDSANVDSYYCQKDHSQPTALTAFITEYGKSRRKIVFDGACATLNQNDVEFAFNSSPHMVVIHTQIAEEAIYAANRLALKNEIPQVIDIEGDYTTDFELEKLISPDFIILDKKTAKHYTSIEPSGIEQCLKVCMAMSAKVNAKYILIRLGDRGTFIYDGKFYNFSTAIEVYPVDETGASDCFVGAFAYKYLDCKDVRRACDYATVAEAISLLRMGGATSTPTRDDIITFVIGNQLNDEILR